MEQKSTVLDVLSGNESVKTSVEHTVDTKSAIVVLILVLLGVFIAHKMKG